MNLYLLNKDLDVIDVIDTYKSLIWTSRYFSPCDFELYIPASEKMLNELKHGHYLVRESDLTQAMIIENIQIDTSVEESNFLIVSGRCLKSILYRRVIWDQTVLNGDIETCIRHLVNDNLVNSTVADRNVSNLILGAQMGTLKITMSSQYTGDNLGEVISNLCKKHGLGYDVLLDIEEKLFIFILYQGTDRSYDQSDVPRVIFSNDYENLLTTTYTLDSSGFGNVARVAGEGEGSARKTTTVGSGAGLERYEIFVDARDVSSNEGEINDATYMSLLTEKGTKALAETKVKENMEGEVEPNHSFKFHEDYFLGDVVEVVNEYGVRMTPRITEVIETVDDTGIYVIPTFSTGEEG